MISVAMETCCRSTPTACAIPKVMASVMGMESAMRKAERHSQKPISAISTTRPIASYSASMNRSIFSLTCRG